MYRPMIAAVCAVSVLSPAAALAATPRELLTTAAFQAHDRPAALALIGQAITASDRILATRPADHEATLQRAIAIGYRAKLTRTRADARASLDAFERLAAQNPRDAEAQMAIAGWHLDALDQLGTLMARTVLGARAQAGEDALARALALGGNRAFYPGLAALMTIRRDASAVAMARRYAENASAAPVPTALDAVMKRAAIALLPLLRAGNGATAAALARKLLPFGSLGA